jgi:curved DNA-binding protein CbpA
MKDFYKILGVKETASEEEIRARWIKLTKHYHPDLGKTDEGGDAKIKEINEAYEVLKDDSKRLDYDLDRTLKKFLARQGQSRKERRIDIQKIILPAGILVLCLIVGLVIFRWFPVAVPPKSEGPYQIDKILEKKTGSQIPPAKTKLESPVPSSPSLSPAEKESKQKEELVPQVVMKSEMPAKAELPKQISRELPTQVSKEVPKDSKEVPRQINQVLPQESAKMDQPKSAVMEPPPPPKTEILAEVEQARPASLPFPPPFAEEDEVKQFFADYRDRYTQKDSDRFLSLFSIRAIHNQKDGFDKIRKIYTNFFDQSEELKFRLEDTNIEIYQNIVEVKARFRVDQILKKSGEEKVWRGNIRWLLMREEGALKILSLDYRNEKTP